MKTRFVFLAFLLLFFAAKSNSVQAQECEMIFMMEEGVVLEYHNYDNKDKETSWEKRTVTDKHAIDGGLSLTMHVETHTAQDSIYHHDLTFECRNGVITVDMSGYLSQEALAPYLQTMTVEVNTQNMTIPQNLATNTVLDNGSVTAKISNNGVAMMTISCNITNRKVVGNQSITTKAGTFDCMKITYDSEVKMMFRIEGSGIEYISDKYGTIRTESYDKRGKLLAYTVLEKVTE